MGRTQIQLQGASQGTRHHFRTGVSLHSHTLHSRERMDFIYRAADKFPPLAAAVRKGEREYLKRHSAKLNFANAWWTPPLGSHEAWTLEKNQIENLGMDALVSLTDHDDIDGGVSLQVVGECQDAPISVEWTVPFRSTFFHLGIHNLPSSSARALFADMQAYTARPEEHRLGEVLNGLAGHPDVLVVFNHPLWDEKGVGQSLHNDLARLFLRTYSSSLHALELNGMRPWPENRDSALLAEAAGKPAISGGDRHVVEPNAILNLTNAANFAEFVEEVRSGWSNVQIQKHYCDCFGLRIFQNMVEVLRPFENHANGWRLWSDRCFYHCADGNIRSLTELFSQSEPAAVTFFVGALQLASVPQVRGLLRRAFPATQEVVL
jgi:hypothetical protein